MKAPGLKPSKLKCDFLVSSLCFFECNVYCYIPKHNKIIFNGNGYDAAWPDEVGGAEHVDSP